MNPSSNDNSMEASLKSSDTELRLLGSELKTEQSQPGMHNDDNADLVVETQEGFPVKQQQLQRLPTKVIDAAADRSPTKNTNGNNKTEKNDSDVVVLRDCAQSITMESIHSNDSMSCSDTSSTTHNNNNCNNMTTASTSAQLTTNPSNNNMSLREMLHQARRTSWTQKLTATPISLESATRQRFARRNSFVSDMLMAKTQLRSLTPHGNSDDEQDGNSKRSSSLPVPECPSASAAKENDLGYGEDSSNARKRSSNDTTAVSIASPPPAKKRRRFQRRNSFYIPETSRSPGDDTTSSRFTWKAMDFLYGRTTASEQATTTLATVAPPRENSPTPAAVASAD